MKPMTTHERMQRMFAHREADRVPITDGPWGATIERWQREGLPKDVDWADYFELDKYAGVGGDISPRLPEATLEETDDYIVRKTSWGVTMKNWKHQASTPEYIDFTVKTPDDWKKVKARMTPSRDRIDWDNLKKNYRTWREEGRWITGGLWFGFDVTHAWFVGTERLLMAMAEEPEWCSDMFNHYLDCGLGLLDMIWNEGYTFDAIGWPDDMGYKFNQFFSLRMYREILKPVQKRAIAWAHAKGIKAGLHSCGDIRPLLPELVEIGLDALNPMEVKAGMDPLQIKKTYGDKLLLHGGVNAMLWDKPELIEAEMNRVIPVLKEKGGYLFSSDHSIPSSVSLKDMTRIVALAKQLGAYA